MLIEIEFERHNRHAIALHRRHQLVQLALMQQQLARLGGFVIMAVTGNIFGNIGIHQIAFALAHSGEAMRQIGLAEAQRFHFRALQHQTGFKGFSDLKIATGAAVFSNCAVSRAGFFTATAFGRHD